MLEIVEFKHAMNTRRQMLGNKFQHVLKHFRTCWNKEPTCSKNIQSNKKTIKQTINQSKQTISKERKRKNPKEETLYKKIMQLPIDRPRRLLC